jgi:hypothetical protein
MSYIFKKLPIFKKRNKIKKLYVLGKKNFAFSLFLMIFLLKYRFCN